MLTIIPCRDGRLWHQDADGNHWRGYFYIEGAEAHNHVNSTALAEEAARAFGVFQRHLAGMGGDRLADTIPDFHNTRARFNVFRRAVEENRAGRRDAVAKEIDWCLSREATADVLLDLLAAGKLPEGHARAEASDWRMAAVGAFQSNGMRLMCIAQPNSQTLILTPECDGVPQPFLHRRDAVGAIG